MLTYTPSNPAPFQVEMGNIGQHYYRWRYPTGAPSLPVAAVPPAVAGPSPTGQPTATTAPAAGIPGEIYNCADFPSQAAQPYLRQYPSDPSSPDADNDGIACESNKAPKDLTPVTRT